MQGNEKELFGQFVLGHHERFPVILQIVRIGG